VGRKGYFWKSDSRRHKERNFGSVGCIILGEAPGDYCKRSRYSRSVSVVYLGSVASSGRQECSEVTAVIIPATDQLACFVALRASLHHQHRSPSPSSLRPFLDCSLRPLLSNLPHPPLCAPVSHAHLSIAKPHPELITNHPLPTSHAPSPCPSNSIRRNLASSVSISSAVGKRTEMLRCGRTLSA
jgi:hypothetical protein